MGANDTNFRLKNRITLNIATIYLPSYYKPDDMGTLKKAETVLDKHNIGLRIWPLGGKKGSQNTLPLERYKEPIKDTREAYQQLRKDVNEHIQNKGTGYPFVVPVIFCQFQHPGHGITPPGTKIGAASAACLISPNPQADQMTVLHELGHASGCDHMHGDEHLKNVMHERDGRENVYKSQVELLAKAFFARPG